MSSSFRKFDYRVRPSKQVERRMIGESMHLLRRLHDVAEYKYIGFGGMAFQDFVMMHKTLGLTDMVSIEHKSNCDRAAFNRPFSCIEIKPGNSKEVLINLDWAKRAIVWLDYDKSVRDHMISDMATCAAALKPGSVLLVTVNCDSGKSPSETFADMTKNVSASLLPTGVSVRNVAGKEYAKLVRYLFTQSINKSIHDRSEVVAADEPKVTAKQFLFFEYRDGAKMCTLGWLIDTEDNLLEQCGFHKLPWYVDGETAHKIRVPVVTPPEMRHLNALLPCTDSTPPVTPGLAITDAEDYRRIYRHIPLYAEIWEG